MFETKLHLGFLTCHLLFVVISIDHILGAKKGSLVLLLNEQHNSVLDVFFKNVTMMAEWPLWIICLILFFVLRLGTSLTVLINMVITTLLTIALKKGFFADWPRPVEYFSGIHHLSLVEDIPMAHWNSCPSGHAAIIFAFLTLIMLIYSTKHWMDLALWIVAIVVALSRIYLSQHFLFDIVAGSVLGISIAHLSFWMMNTYFIKRDWYNWGIFVKNQSIEKNAAEQP